MPVALLVIAIGLVHQVWKKIQQHQRRGDNPQLQQQVQNRRSSKELERAKDKHISIKTKITVGKFEGERKNKMPSSDSSDSVSVDESFNDSTVSVIRFQANDNQCCREIITENCKVIGSSGAHDHGSSKVKLKNVVDYKWEVKQYAGHLLATHMNGKVFAYVIKAKQVEGQSRQSYMLRVCESSCGLRSLIKGMSGEVLDLQFAHIEKEYIIAAIDSHSLFVHKIEVLANTLVCTSVLQINDPLDNYTPKFDKLVWCPYVESADDATAADEDDESKMLLWTRGKKLQVFHLETILEDLGSGPLKRSDIKNGVIEYTDPTYNITWAQISPDGSTMSISLSNGQIKFYQIYFHDPEPRCLHTWSPHDGKPVTSFFFLDNLNCKRESYWKFAVTATDNNTEFKIWDCGTWACLQTVYLSTSSSAADKSSRFIVEMDRTASYMVATNYESRSCYVFQIVNLSEWSQSNSGGNNTKETLNLTQSTQSSSTKTDWGACVLIKSVAEFPLHSGILSFSIVDAAVRQYKCGSDNYMLEELGGEYDEDSVCCVIIFMYIVQQKSIQECRIFYQPLLPENADVKSTLYGSDVSAEVNATTTSLENGNSSKDKDVEPETGSLIKGVEQNEKDALESLLGLSAPSSLPPTGMESSSVSPASVKSNKVNLMTPDVFSASEGGAASSSADRKTTDVSSEVFNTLMMLAQTHSKHQGSATPAAEQKKPQKNTKKEKKFVAIGSENLTSGGSSPSREVQEIMSYQGSGANSYSGDDELLLEESLPPNNLELVASEINVPASAAATTASSSGKKPSKHSAELQNAANLISQQVNPIPMSNANPPNVASDMAEMTHKINQLMEMVRLQSAQIKSLQSDIHQLRDANPLATKQGAIEFSFKLEMQLSKLMENYLKRYENEHKKKLQAFMSGRENMNREMRENFVQVVNQFLLAQLNDMVAKSVAVEVQRQICPLIAMKIDAMHQQVSMELAQKMAAFDMMLKENISQVCKSKSVIEAFGKSVLLGVQGSLQQVFIEAMSTTLIPAYEKSSQNMFMQLHEAFTIGIKEFLEQFNTYLIKLQPMADKSGKIIEKVHEFCNHFDVLLNQQRTVIAESLMETRKDVKNMEILLARQMQELFRKSLETQTAVRSQASTPAPMVDLKEAIRALMQQGQINKAFHQALLANDLSLVEFTLKNVDCSAVFSPQCVLEQKVLLSLIQQISADMSNHDAVKQNFLSEALLAIDPKDPISRQHAPKILDELYRSCTDFLKKYPRNSQATNVRMMLKGVGVYNRESF